MFDRPTKEEILKMIEYRDGKLSWLRKRGQASAGFRCGTPTAEGRRQTSLLGRRYYNFNIVWFIHTGDWSDDCALMPKDGDNGNEAFENLEQRKPDKSYSRSKSDPTFVARLEVNETSIYLGTYHTLGEKLAAEQGADRLRKAISGVSQLVGLPPVE